MDTVNRAPRSETTEAAADATNRLVYLIKLLQEALRARLNEVTKRFGLTPNQYAALTVLARCPGISAAELGRLSFVTTQAANEMVTALERKGLLERTVNQHNRRQLAVAVTPAGAATLARCDALVDQLEAEMLRGMSDTDRDRFRETIRSCLHALSRPEGKESLGLSHGAEHGGGR